jgi:hypothetical protein
MEEAAVGPMWASGKIRIRRVAMDPPPMIVRRVGQAVKARYLRMQVTVLIPERSMTIPVRKAVPAALHLSQ